VDATVAPFSLRLVQRFGGRWFRYGAMRTTQLTEAPDICRSMAGKAPKLLPKTTTLSYFPVSMNRAT
jgi:hypothetical protein